MRDARCGGRKDALHSLRGHATQPGSSCVPALSTLTATVLATDVHCSIRTQVIIHRVQVLARLLPLAFDPATEPAPALRQALSVGLEAFAGVGPAATRALVSGNSEIGCSKHVHAAPARCLTHLQVSAQLQM